MADIAVRGEGIRLGQLLKLAGVVDSGSDVKALLAAEPVSVTGSPRRAAVANCRGGDSVVVGEQELYITGIVS